MTEETRLEFTVPSDASGERLDRILALLLSARQYSRAQIRDWIARGKVTVSGGVCEKAARRMKAGESIAVEIPPPRPLTLEPDAEVPLPIVFEDDDLLVLDKPAGLLVHPGAGRQEGTLVNGLLHHLGESLQRIGDAFRPGIVHRLDKETSGLMVVAKSPLAYRSLRKQLRPPRTMKRIYLCLAANAPKKGKGSIVSADGQSGIIDLPIGRHPRQRVKMAVVPDKGKPAQTRWKVKEHFAGAVLLEAELETGRTHQIRVHFAECGAPLLGDPVYGASVPSMNPGTRAAVRKLGRQALHAARLDFVHPVSGQIMTFESSPPPEMEALIETVRG